MRIFAQLHPEFLKNLDQHTLLAVNAALHAGKDITDIYLLGEEAFAVQTKADDSPLTAADSAGHARIVSYLESTSIPILSEEGATITYANREQWTQLWIVDPLDGTKEFIKRNGEFTVNIALVENGCPIMGVVYAPVIGSLYFGNSDIGSYRLDLESDTFPFESLEQLIEISDRLPLKSDRRAYTIVASKSHRNEETDRFIAEKEKLHGDVEVVSRGSSLKICLVAEGSADIYPRIGPTMEWDTAAGHGVARAAGASILDPATGEELQYNKPDLLNPHFVVERRRG